MTQTLRHFISNSFIGVTRCSLLITRSRSCSSQKITRYWLQRLLVAKNYSLHVAKLACSSLEKILIARNQSLLVAKFARNSLQKFASSKKSLVTRCKICLMQKFMKKFCDFTEKWLQLRCCPVNFCKILRTSILWNICKRLLLKIIFNVNQLFHFDLIKFDWIVTEWFD